MSAEDVRRTRRPLVRSVLLATALAAVAAVAVPSGAASAGEAAAGYQVPLYAGSGVGTTSVVPAAASTSARSGRAANITVTYTGFSTAAKASFQRAVNIWKSRLNSGVTVKIAANYTNLGNPNILGSAGPTTVHRNFAGAPKQNVWYVAAAANKRAGSDLNGAGTAEIQANFNSSFSNWHFGSGAPPANKYDFETVVLHEIGHGVGSALGHLPVGQLDPLGPGRWKRPAHHRHVRGEQRQQGAHHVRQRQRRAEDGRHQRSGVLQRPAGQGGQRRREAEGLRTQPVPARQQPVALGREHLRAGQRELAHDALPEPGRAHPQPGRLHPRGPEGLGLVDPTHEQPT